MFQLTKTIVIGPLTTVWMLLCGGLGFVMMLHGNFQQGGVWLVMLLALLHDRKA